MSIRLNRLVKSKTAMVIGVVAVVVIIIIWKVAGSSSGKGTAAPEGKHGMGMFSETVPVRVSPVVRGDFALYLNSLGTVIAYNTVNVVSRVQGELVSVLFTEGQEVKRGDVLAVIDPRPFEAALLQARGTEKQNSALLQNAQSELKRYQTLIRQDSVAKQTYDSQVALVKQYQGSLLASQAQVKDAALNVEFTQIKSPIDGRLGIRQVDVGNYITIGASTPIVVITQTKPISATFTVPETQLSEVNSHLQKGESLVVEAWSSDNSKLLASGTLQTLDNQINTSTGTILVKARFANDEGSLFPNQFVNIKLKLATLHDVLIIASDAIQYGNKGTFVYVVEDNKVHLRYVKLGSSDDAKTMVTEGLKVGEQVVLEGTDRLKEGAKVEVVSDKADGAVTTATTATTTTTTAKGN